jgi:uncharacterized protein YjbJ (UPF0337 family)
LLIEPLPRLFEAAGNERRAGIRSANNRLIAVDRHSQYPLPVDVRSLHGQPLGTRQSRVGQPQKENAMNSSTKNEIEGKFHEVKGKVKEKVGELTDNPKLKGEGQGEKVAGKIQKKAGQIQKVFEK